MSRDPSSDLLDLISIFIFFFVSSSSRPLSREAEFTTTRWCPSRFRMAHALERVCVRLALARTKILSRSWCNCTDVIAVTDDRTIRFTASGFQVLKPFRNVTDGGNLSRRGEDAKILAGIQKYLFHSLRYDKSDEYNFAIAIHLVSQPSFFRFKQKVSSHKSFRDFSSLEHCAYGD